LKDESESSWSRASDCPLRYRFVDRSSTYAGKDHADVTRFTFGVEKILKKTNGAIRHSTAARPNSTRGSPEPAIKLEVRFFHRSVTLDRSRG